jgi:DNA (cytosine-5)-methyltransferase 1
MKYGSVCSGVEAATAAWHPLGWEPQWFSEIEKFPSAVLAHHYPDVPNLGDMTQFTEWKDDPIDLLVGGTPCQSFSVAGLRKGLDDPRGNLMLTYLAIAERNKPRWLVWENVPGVLSSNRGRDFGTFLAALGKIGYGFAYRVLDAKYFGVAQRRRRVFVVGYLGDWRRAAAVLFERESMSGHPAPSREAGQKATPTVSQGATFSRTGNERVECEAIVPVVASGKTTIGTLMANSGTKLWLGNQEALTGDYHILHPIAYDTTNITSPTNGSNPKPNDPVYTLASGQHPPLLTPQVRRLTPTECERLQGFPDNFTQIPWRNKAAENCPDGPRYKAMGNSMAVPIMRWIGERIKMVDKIESEKS